MLATQIFLLFYFHYTNAQQTQMLVSNRLYSTWNVVLAQSDLGVSEIYAKLPSNSRMFLEHDTHGNVRTLWQPPLVSGVFFDSTGSRPQAVVGINIFENLDDATVFTIEGYTYEVVGILGAGFPSALDHLVLLNTVDNSLVVERIVPDSTQPAVMNQVIDDFYVVTINQNQALERFLK